jgi:hypothetical protein
VVIVLATGTKGRGLEPGQGDGYLIIMSLVPLVTQVVYKSSPAFSVPGDKPDITPVVLPTFIQCSSSP